MGLNLGQTQNLKISDTQQSVLTGQGFEWFTWCQHSVTVRVVCSALTLWSSTSMWSRVCAITRQIIKHLFHLYEDNAVLGW